MGFVKYPMKSVNILSKEMCNKVLDIYAIDNYMVASGYNSILPVDKAAIDNSGLIWYPFEPFLNQINIWVEKQDDDLYLIKGVEHFCDNNPEL